MQFVIRYEYNPRIVFKGFAQDCHFSRFDVGLQSGTITSTFTEPIPFGGSTRGEYRHACALFSSREEEYATMLPFIRDGIERGAPALHIVRSRYLHLDRLRRARIEVAATQARGQLEVGSGEK